jgi:molecular chaperone GrpE
MRAEDNGSGTPEREAGEEQLNNHGDGGPEAVDVEGSEVVSEQPAPDAPKDWEAEAGRYQDLYLRSVAELDNARRRFQKEREENAKYASESVIKDILPAVNNLDLALSYASPDDPAVKNLAEGVGMTLRGLMDRLGARGLEEIPAERGMPFDPNFHEPLAQVPDPELPDMAISQRVRRGYTLHKRVVQAAQVMVVKNPAA